jgi:hypothetical protein
MANQPSVVELQALIQQLQIQVQALENVAAMVQPSRQLLLLLRQ